MIAACVPLERSARIARQAGWQTLTLESQGLLLRAYDSGAQNSRGGLLHVYLGGDGRPWIDGRHPARDPSALNPLVLDLMRVDPEPALYLGRPCYHGLATSGGCDAQLWTMGRYSERNIDAMGSALNELLTRWQPQGVVLVGYSGGGVLALAIAEKLALPRFVVTLGSNLDVAAWTDYHGYLPLDGSRDPARAPQRYASLAQLHLQAAKDRVVPPATTARYTAALDDSAVVSLAHADHVCCWTAAWQALLRDQPWSSTLHRKAAAGVGGSP